MKFLKPLMFLELKAKESKVSMSFVNIEEANLIASVVRKLIEVGVHTDDIGVITF